MSRTKWKIILQNIRLVDVPTRQNRMFLKIKNCVSTVITKSYQIVNNQCEFTDSIEIEVNFPSNLIKAINKNSRSLKVKPIRISFRLENSSRSGFRRYGIVMLDLLKLILENATQITSSNHIYSFRAGLENCSEKPIFYLNIAFPQGMIPKNIILAPSSQNQNETNDVSITTNSTSISNVANNSSSQYSSPICSQSSQSNKNSNQLCFLPHFDSISPPSSHSNSNTESKSKKLTDKVNSLSPVSSLSIPTMSISNPAYHSARSSTRNSNSLGQKKQCSLESLPIKMSKQRYYELEGEIDNLLAGIINDESIQ